jgi:four helix bundle protein
MKYIPIDDLEVYKLAMEIGEDVWGVVDKWPELSVKIVGIQFCKAADSIAANISEAHGRFHFKDKKNFCYFARGSLLESKTWLKKSHNRKLVTDEVFAQIHDKLARCHFLLNQYIKSIGTAGTSDDNILREPNQHYGLPDNFDYFNDFDTPQ